MSQLDTKDVIRQVENTVLDRKYKQYTLFYRHRYHSLGHILKIYGHFERSMIDTDILRNMEFMKRINVHSTFLNGLGHCIRWTSKHTHRRIQLPETTWMGMDREAMEFLDWGFSYAKLVLDHTAYSRGEMLASVDNDAKTITFSYKDNINILLLLQQTAAQEILREKILEAIPYQKLENFFPEWVKNTNRDREIGNMSPDVYDIANTWIDNTLWPDIPPETELGGYSLWDFRRFFAALFVNSLFISQAEEWVDETYGPDNEFGSIIISKNNRDMGAWLSSISGVSRPAISNIISDLIFDVNNIHSSLAAQPFVKAENNKILLLGRMFSSLDPIRMIAGALKQNGKKKYYDSLIGIMEKNALIQIEITLKNFDFDVIREPNIQVNGAKITPDFLLFDITHNILIVVDYKHYLGTLSVREVLNRKSDILSKKEGVNQIRRYVSFINKNRLDVGKRFNIDILEVKIIGLLVFRWPMPIPIDQFSDVLLSDWVSLENVLSNGDSWNLQLLVDWIKTRPDIGIELEKWRYDTEQIRVDDWTYIRPILVMPD